MSTPTNSPPNTPHDARHASTDPGEDDPDIDLDSDDSTPPHGQATRLTLVTHPDASGQRLDKVLATAFADFSRSRLKALMEQGAVTLDGRTITDASFRVKPGQTIDLWIPEPEPAAPEPEDIPLDVVYEDDDLLVIDKPAGMVVHPAAGNPRGTLVNALLAHCGGTLSGIGGVRRPGIVHRLDKDTSGLMVVAKTDLAHAGLAAQFADRTLSRTYLAVTIGVPFPPSGEIDAPIGRSPTDRKKMAVVASGKPAVTRYKMLRAFGRAAALVECTLLTGRTHQIRVHMTRIGHPLVGDPVYGKGRAARPASAPLRELPEHARLALVSFNRQALHAARLRFIHPRSQEPMQFTSELPLDIQALIQSLELL